MLLLIIFIAVVIGISILAWWASQEIGFTIFGIVLGIFVGFLVVIPFALAISGHFEDLYKRQEVEVINTETYVIDSSNILIEDNNYNFIVKDSNGIITHKHINEDYIVKIIYTDDIKSYVKINRVRPASDFFKVLYTGLNTNFYELYINEDVDIVYD
jgi:4-amino-4-deoxy-L-arabinose transferase-like glycosyltransferase